MRTLIFILFSALIGYLTKNIWLQLNHWYYMIFFLMVIILIPFILYSLAGKIAFKTGWLVGLITMIIFTIIDNYLTNAMSFSIISKSNNGFFDTSGFKLSLDLLKLPWYTYLVSGIMGLITGIIGDKQRQREKEREQRAIFLGLYLLAGQFLGMAVPELTPIISRVTPVVTTVMTAEVASKTGSLAIAESSKIAEKHTFTKVEPTLVATSEEAVESVLKVKYFKFSYIKNGQKVIRDIPDFFKHSIFERKLPSNLQVAPDKLQFIDAMKTYSKEFYKNPELSREILKRSNQEMLERDILYYEKNKASIEYAEKKMLEATKNNDLVEQTKWLKELRRITNKITFIETPRGKPLVRYTTEEEVWAKQKFQIENPSSFQGRFFGYVIHHTEKNTLQFVQKDIHEYNRHIGGNTICGGGVR
jgi:hypothetical protein